MARTSSRLLIRKFVGKAVRFPFSGTPVCIQGTQSHWGWHSFVESHSGSEGKSCASKVAVLGLWTCTYKQNKKPPHEDYLARFWYPCQTAEKDSRSRAVIWSLLISGLGMWYCNQLMTSTNDEVSFWHVLTMTTFWEWLQNNSRFLRIMLTKKRDFRGSFTVIRHEKFDSRLLRTE